VDGRPDPFSSKTLTSVASAVAGRRSGRFFPKSLNGSDWPARLLALDFRKKIFAVGFSGRQNFQNHRFYSRASGLNGIIHFYFFLFSAEIVTFTESKTAGAIWEAIIFSQMSLYNLY